MLAEKNMSADETFRLKVTREDGEIWIRGNRKGLEYLSQASAKIIGKTDPSGHIHISPVMNNSAPGSEAVRLEYSDDPKDYE